MKDDNLGTRKEALLAQAFLDLLRAISKLVRCDEDAPMNLGTGTTDRVARAQLFFASLPLPDTSDSADRAAEKRIVVRRRLMAEEVTVHLASLESASTSAQYVDMWDLASSVHQRLLTISQEIDQHDE